ncbi:hypothetical protein BXY80_1079 [Ichthyenterobacterium magnum]|uniref:Uncharacterized protein n=1 Tax=Ichthyenterobacterium magnum TaxID=1230530 RepID=A0A420DXS2_9FLAO|nr:hypothetical protein BXY80_1079 [Ichthyenterobacterium magnum]
MPLRDDYDYSKEELDNHSNTMNPEHDNYWDSRGEENPNS